MRSPNFLILDESTNDLDIVTLGILEEYLVNFKGCLIVISHDRYFLDNIVEHLFVMEGNGVIKDFPGNYSEYRQWLDEQQKEHIAEKAASSKPAEKPKENRQPKLTYKERKELEQITAELEALNAEKDELEALFNSGEQINDIAAKSQRYNEIKEIIDEKEFRWLELSEKE
jgi:ATP-binding cassette subfamily F protein uup